MATTNATTPASSCISQGYFDEVCIENAEIFDLSEEDAVQETIKQLSSSGSVPLNHLSLTFPTSSQGLQERQERRVFVQALEAITVEKESREGWMEALTVLEEKLSQQQAVYEPLLNVHDGVASLMSLFESLVKNDNKLTDDTLRNILLRLFHILNELLESDRKLSLLRSFQDAVRPSIAVWLECYQNLLSKGLDDAQNITLMKSLLSLATFSVLKYEDNKKAWMQQRTQSGASIVTLLMDTLETVTSSEGDTFTNTGKGVCRFMTVLCTFDDFRTSKSGAAPTVSSAHANVQSFYQQNAIGKLHALLQKQADPAIVLALRAMAIQDEIVQNMVAVGLLDTASQLLNDNDDSVEMLSAVIGLFRNLSANDEIKTRLCLGSQSIVPAMVQAMKTHLDSALLQEHGCGTIAAMALRQPKNAQQLVQSDAHTAICMAMKKHPSKTTLQRQAALAIRNLVSRSTELRPLLIQAGAESVLRDIAGKHLSCQDEVYAALRDLGLSASTMQVEQDEGGKVVMRSRQMFGERNSNFRPVYD